MLVSIGSKCFQSCTSLTDVRFPVATSCSPTAFRECTSLELVDLGMAKSISSTCFYDCTVLSTLILRKNDAVTTLSNANAFTNSPFASGGTGGTVYVPSALIESYKTASNWSALYEGGTCNFVALEGREYE